MQNNIHRKCLVFVILVLIIKTSGVSSIICNVDIDKYSPSLLDSGLVSYWDFDESTVNVLHDASGNGKDSSDFPATGFFRLENDSGVWWFVNPEGKKFFVVGAAGVAPGRFYYDNISDWVNDTRERLEEWGFNACTSPEYFSDIPFVTRTGTKSIVGRNGWVPNPRFPDVFDKDWKENVTDRINKMADIYRNNSYLIGYMSDNEMKWGPDDSDNRTLLELYMAAPAESPGKQKLISFLKERYDNVSDFNDTWNMNIETFDDLNNSQQFGFEGWRVQSPLHFVKLKLFRDHPLFIKKPLLLKKAEKDVTDFSRLLAKTYFSFINSTFKTADPNHLYLGVRFHFLGVPREVLEECGNYSDVISINYYRRNSLIYDSYNDFLSKLCDCVPLDHWMRNYYEISGKPLLVQEFNSQGNDGSWPIYELYHARTQKQRADTYNWYVLNCQNSPYMVGQGFYFLYADDIHKNRGMVNPWGEPYQTFVENITVTNKNAIELHENASFKNINYKRQNLHLYMDIESLFSSVYNFLANRNSIQERKDQICDLFNKNKDIVEYPNYEEEFYQTNVVRNSNKKNIKVLDDIIYVDNDSSCPGNGTDAWPYCKIQYAIDNATNGDIIWVYNGTYSEKLIINKSISLVGENRTVTNISGVYKEPDDKYQNKVINIKADHVKITGFNITTEGGWIGTTGNYRYCTGLYLLKHNNCNISGNIFYKLTGYGIISLKSDHTKITNNVFNNPGVRYGCGIITDHSNNTLIYNNTFKDNELYGIWMSFCKNNKIQNNCVSKSIFGIIIWKAHDNTIFGNTFWKNNKKGICLKECYNNNLTSNNFYLNPSHANFFYSDNNNWDGNFWGRPRIFPKLILGKTGKDALTPVFDWDFHPLKKPYKPSNSYESC